VEGETRALSREQQAHAQAMMAAREQEARGKRILAELELQTKSKSAGKGGFAGGFNPTSTNPYFGAALHSLQGLVDAEARA
jgi:hypothetical protein